MSAAYGITIFSVRRVDFACQSPTTGHRKGLTSMKIIKRNGSEAVFDIMKIITAVTKANNVVKEDEQHDADADPPHRRERGKFLSVA